MKLHPELRSGAFAQIVCAVNIITLLWKFVVVLLSSLFYFKSSSCTKLSKTAAGIESIKRKEDGDQSVHSIVLRIHLGKT